MARLSHSKRRLVRRSRALATYIQAQIPRKLSGQELSDIMFAADLKSYRDTGKSLSGLTWYAAADGPEPRLS